jgi:hypothetical protein
VIPPPPPAYPGQPVPSEDDPTAGGHYCGARRNPRQLAAAIESGDPTPWPWCRNRAGFKTDHVGIDHCHVHGGNTPGQRTRARVRLAELVHPAVAVLATMLTDSSIPPSIRLRAAQDVLDRSGHPRRVEVDADDARAMLYDRLSALREAEEAEDDDPEHDDEGDNDASGH